MIEYNDPLKNIMSYNDEMTISQVVRYFERHGVTYTKPMIQSYVRLGILPPPKNKRAYTRAHLVLLVLIDDMKKVFTFEEMKRIFGLIIDDHESFPDDADFMIEVYRKYREILNRQREALSSEKCDVSETDRENESFFLQKLSYMAKSVMARDMAVDQSE